MRSGLRMAVAWGLLHATVIATDDYVPMHKRHSFDPLLDDFSYLGMLSRRDVCSDAFGEDAERATCVPSGTLCCIRRSQSFPSCQQYLGKGWCCVGENDNDSCYVDQESACRDENAVECANLEEGTERACCPRFTTCDRNLKASESYVRCNINQGDLKSFHSASIASTATTSSSTSETSEAATETSTTTSSTVSSGPTGETQQDSKENHEDGALSGGAIAGIAVGGVAGLALVGAAIWFFLRRNKKNQQQGEYQAAQQDPHLTIPQFYENQQMKQQQYGGGHQGQYDPAYAGHQMHNNGYHSGYSSPHNAPSELPDERNHAVEMDGSSNVHR